MTGENGEALSTREYLGLVFLNPLSAAGLVVAASGALLVAIVGPGTGPSTVPLIGGALLLGGMSLFALGFTRAQHRVKDRGWGS